MGMCVVVTQNDDKSLSAVGPFKTAGHAASYAAELYLAKEDDDACVGIGVVELEAPDPAIEAAANA